MKPFLRWAGSKKRLIPHLKDYWRPDQRYIEPFMGSACLFFDLKPRKAVLGDLNLELVRTFRAIKSNPVRVHKALLRLPKRKTEYLRLRKLDPVTLTDFSAAARFIYLNRFCFNGLYRTNLAGEFNVPYAPAKSGSLPTLEQLKECSNQLLRVKVVFGDFLSTTKHAEKGDFIYLDPPYSVENRRVFKQYGKDHFGASDLKRLRDELTRLDSIGANFVASYADSPEGRRAFSKWKRVRVRTRRNISGFVDSRRHAYELIATNIRSES